MQEVTKRKVGENMKYGDAIAGLISNLKDAYLDGNYKNLVLSRDTLDEFMEYDKEGFFTAFSSMIRFDDSVPFRRIKAVNHYEDSQ